ncbi:MAG: glycosyltransferase family 2 protein [Acidobacteria bacterium]|nr:glycosyltransferase family 2 protein [Acidobacteriota bacterium]
MAGNVPAISVIVISRNEGGELRLTVENLKDTLPARSEIIVVDDGSSDGSAKFLQHGRGSVRLYQVKGYGVARARAFGTDRAKGDLLIYSDAHLRMDPFWWRPLHELLEDPGVGAAAPGMLDFGLATRPGFGLTFKNSAMEVRWHRRAHGVQESLLLPGACFATRRDVVEQTGGWDSGLMHRGNVDNECCVRFWLMGYRLLVTPDSLVRHKFRKSSPYPVGWAEYLFNRLRLAFVHLKADRLGKVVARLRSYPQFGRAMELIAESDISTRRNEVRQRRVRDDDWLFERFGLTW